MLSLSRKNCRGKKYIFASIFGMMLGISSVLPARALTADDVLNKMKDEERHAYFAGMIEGLGYARFLRDRPDDSGSRCIYDWYFKDRKQHQKKLQTWFERHPDKPASTLLYVLIKKECGE